MKQLQVVWRLCSAVGFAFLTMTCSPPDRWDNPPVDVEYTVYSTVIDSLLKIANREYPPKQVVMLNRWYLEATFPEHVMRNQLRREELVESSVIERFFQVNRSPVALRDSFEAPYEITLVSPDSLCPVALTDDFGGWDCLREHYPGAEGIVLLYRAAFDKRQRRAFVIAAFAGRYSADYFHFVLESSDDKWAVTKLVSGAHVDHSW